MAAQRTGWQTIGFSEIEIYASKILKRHWPEVPNYGDIRNVRNVRADIITGGFPCQPYSLAGRRAGAIDDRALWPEMLRVIAESKPSWVLGENVPGIVSMELDNVLSDLESLGYAAWPIAVPACAVDAKHRRERIWIVAHATRERLNGSGNKRAGGRAESANGSETLANSTSVGRENGGRIHSGLSGQAAETACAEIIGGAWYWSTEPGMGRVAHGIPHRTHRLKGLGNAIVPQVAETLMREMVRMENA